MINSIKIINQNHSPLNYLNTIPALKENTQIEFKPGVNIIIGPNGCGKSTLIKLIAKYTCCSTENKTNYHNSYFELSTLDKDFYDGVEVKADYSRYVFRLKDPNELHGENGLKDFTTFKQTYTSKNASTGQSILHNFYAVIEEMFKYGNQSPSKINVDEKYLKYIEVNNVKGNQVTMLLDEPDRNLDIDNIQQIEDIIKLNRSDIQLIMCLHNPILIYLVSKLDFVNIIELENGYLNKIYNIINKCKSS